MTKITQSGEEVSDKRVDLSYDAASQMSSVTRYSDLTGTELIADSTYTFDQASRLTDLIHQQNETTLAEFGLVYDKGDRITQFTTPDGVSDFSYDDSDQLVVANYENQADENYSYDDNGNRTNAGYVTGANNQLLSDGTYNYEYDNEGNRTKQIEIATGVVTEYEWDHRNRLVAVVTKDLDGNITADVSYTYDVFDNRISKSVDADGDGAGEALVERYVLDGDHIALIFDGEGNQIERFLHGLEIDQILASENADGEVLWALTDHQNSVRIVLDNNGEIVNQISYDSFGQIVNETNPDVDFRFSYTGREFDAETGNYYYRARYYDPSAGRFISEDPISFAAGDSNIYRYVGNNPLFYLDPSGFCGVPFGDNSDNNDFWQNVSDFFILPAEAGTFPPGFDSALDSPFGDSSDVLESNSDRTSFPRDDTSKVALAPAIPMGIKILLEAAAIGGSLEYQRRQQGKDEKDQSTSQKEFEEALKRDAQQNEPSILELINDGFQQFNDDVNDLVDKFIKGDDSGELESNNINNQDQQQSEPLTEQVTPPLNRDLDLEGQTPGIPREENRRPEPTKDFEQVNNDLPSYVFDSRNDSQPLTNSQAKDLASELGFKKVRDIPFNSHGKAVFTNGKQYITPDRDGHNGGVWKVFDRKGRRVGTYNKDLSERINK